MAKTVRYVPILILSLMTACCAANRQVNRQAPAAGAEFLLHRVHRGETLGGIAKWYTGKESQWRVLARSNPNLEPRRLRRGELVRVPLWIATLHTRPPVHATAFRKRRKVIGKRTDHSKRKIPAPPEEVFGPK